MSLYESFVREFPQRGNTAYLKDFCEAVEEERHAVDPPSVTVDTHELRLHNCPRRNLVIIRRRTHLDLEQAERVRNFFEEQGYKTEITDP